MGAIGSLISGIFNTGQTALTNAANIKAQEMANETNIQLQREANQANLDLANLQYQNDVNMWNLQNAYNTPAAQMQRYKDAGLNPYLIYGSGSGSSGNASSAPSYNSGTARQQAAQVRAAQQQAARFNDINILGSIMPILNFWQDIRMKDANIEHLRNQDLLLSLQGQNYQSQIGLRTTQNDYWQKQVDNYEKRLNAAVDNMIAGKELRELQYVIKKNLWDNYTSKGLLTPAEKAAGSWQSQIGHHLQNGITRLITNKKENK